MIIRRASVTAMPSSTVVNTATRRASSVGPSVHALASHTRPVVSSTSG
jgi:hypothetical protein